MEQNIVREIHINPQLLEQVAKIGGNLSNVISARYSHHVVAGTTPTVQLSVYTDFM